VELKLGVAERLVAARKIARQRVRSGKPDKRSHGEEESTVPEVMDGGKGTARGWS
jgi:hypothetical protein